MTDVKLFQSDNGGEIKVIGGQVEMVGGLESAAYIAMFSGKKWWGGKLGGETGELLKSLPATSSNLNRVRDAIKRDLAFLEADLIVDLRITGLNKIEIKINVNGVDDWVYRLNWGYDFESKDQSEPVKTINGSDYVYQLPNETIIDSFNHNITGMRGLAFDGENLIGVTYTGVGQIYVFDGVSGAVLDSFTHSKYLTGATVINGDLVVSSNIEGKFWVMDGVSNVVKQTEALGNCGGLANDGANLINGRESGSGTISIHDGTSAPFSVIQTPNNGGTSGLAFDGVNLAVCSNIQDNIMISTGLVLPHQRVFPSPGTYPAGMTFANNHLISNDYLTKTFYVHGKG